MFYLLQSELFRLRKRPMSWVMPVILGGLIAAVYVIFYFAARHSADPSRLDRITLPWVFNIGGTFVIQVGIILLTVLASSVIGSEYSWNTIRPLLARARSRGAMLTAKWITTALYTVLLVVFGMVVSIIASYVMSRVAGLETGATASLFPEVVIGTGRLIWAAAPYAALAFLIALWTKSNAAGISVGLAVFFVEPIAWLLLRQFNTVFDTIEKAGISWNATELINANMHGARGDAAAAAVSTTRAWESAGVLGIYVVVAVVLTYFILNRRDVTSG
jgi:ABC-type transport system involved in multi-copper enzyme maturation permease subunit